MLDLSRSMSAIKGFISKLQYNNISLDLPSGDSYKPSYLSIKGQEVGKGNITLYVMSDPQIRITTNINLLFTCNEFF